MTKIVYDSQKLVKGVIGNVNSAITNLNEAKRIVGSLDIPSLNSEGYIRGLSSTIDDIVASCNLCITGVKCSGIIFFTFTLPPVIAVAHKNVPASILSGITL